MQNDPRVSIGLPVFNGERYLRGAIESVLNQSFQDFELILSDNASTDSTWDICQSYAKQDRRIRLNRNRANIGANSNFRLALELARAPYFTWIAHDDLLAEGFIEQCHEFLSTHPDYVLCCPENAVIDEHGGWIYSVFSDYDLTSDRPDARYLKCLDHYAYGYNAIYGLIRNDALKSINYDSLTFAPDHFIVLSLSLLGKFRHINEVLRMYRFHGDQISLKAEPETQVEVFLGPNKEIPVFPRMRFFLRLFSVVLSTRIPLSRRITILRATFVKCHFSRRLQQDLMFTGAVWTRNHPFVKRQLKRVWQAIRG